MQTKATADKKTGVKIKTQIFSQLKILTILMFTIQTQMTVKMKSNFKRDKHRLT